MTTLETHPSALVLSPLSPAAACAWVGALTESIVIPSSLASPPLADADQLLVDEFVRAQAPTLPRQPRAFRSAELKRPAIGPDDVHIDHPGVELIRPPHRLIRVRGHHVGAEA